MHHNNGLLGKTKNKVKAGDKYRAQRNAMANVIRRGHEKYAHDTIGDLEKSTSTDQYACIKRFWHYVKGKKKECTGVPTPHTKDGIDAADKG